MQHTLPRMPQIDGYGRLYETSGEWLNTVGLPGKSGIGGGIVMVTEDGGRRLNNTSHELRTVR